MLFMALQGIRFPFLCRSVCIIKLFIDVFGRFGKRKAFPGYKCTEVPFPIETRTLFRFVAEFCAYFEDDLKEMVNFPTLTQLCRTSGFRP